MQPIRGWGVKFNCIEGLVTNFHLPESTLIMLIAALYGYDNRAQILQVRPLVVKDEGLKRTRT